MVAAAVAVASAPTREARWNEAAVATLVVAYTVVGLLIVWHRPAELVGRIAVTAAPVLAVGEALVQLSYAVLRDQPDDRLAALGSVSGGLLRGTAWLVLVLWLPLRFPDGRLPRSRLGRTTTWVVVATIACFAVVGLLSPRLTDLRVQQVDSPVGLPAALAPATEAFAGLSLLAGVLSIVLVVACLVQRYRHAGPLGRQQTLLFGVAFVPPVLAFVASTADAAPPWLFGLATLPLPVAIGTALLQRRLYDLPLVLNRSLTHASLWLVVALLYALVVGGVGALLQQRGAPWLPWLAAGVVAVAFAPLREALQGAANRLTFGQWAQPAEVLDRTARRLADAADVQALLDSLTAELAGGLGLGHVEIVDREGTPLAVAGTPSGELDELPLVQYGEPVGTLRWTWRPMRPVDRELLARVAEYLGHAVHAAALLGSVRATQERLVLAREEERRRLRRDLHDGLGPTLAALTLQVDTLGNTHPDPTLRADLLRLRGHIQDTVHDVRRLVEGLQPAPVADLGLVEAVRQLAAGAPLEVAVECDTGCALGSGQAERLPAGVEVAAYRIAQEALTNAVRHAEATVVRIGLHLGPDCLEVCVADDGHGRLTPRPGGVGLRSMRERAEEIGGELTLTAVPGVGTTVRARLPLASGGGP